MSKLKQKGQGMVEFALILIPLLMLILGIIEAARVFQAYLAVQHSAREAARYAITGQPFNEFDPSQGPFMESDEVRAEAIKQIAIDQALGLSIDFWGLTPDDFDANINRPGFFGVDIYGFDKRDEPEQRDDPGQPGLPIRVRVVYNVIILDPLYRAIMPHVRLVGHAEMVNEGFQVGQAGAPPPVFADTPTFPAEPPEPPTSGPYIALSDYDVRPEQVLIIDLIQHDSGIAYDVYWIKPSGTEEPIGTFTTDGDGNVTLPAFIVPVDSENGTYTITSREGGADVTSCDLTVSGGSPPLPPYITLSTYAVDPNQTFNIYLNRHAGDTLYNIFWIPPGSPEIQIDSVTTDPDGSASLPYTVPADSFGGTHRIESRLEDGTTVSYVNLTVKGALPTATQTPIPTGTPTGAYIALAGSYDVLPGDVITIQLIQHEGNTFYEVYWIAPGPSETLIDTVSTNASGNALVYYTVPAGSGGSYTIESREMDGTFVDDLTLQVLTVTPTPTVYVPADLVITDITLGSATVSPGTPVTVTVQIRNNGGPAQELFDIDLYIDPEYAPLRGHPGDRKQWQDGLASGGTATLVFDVIFHGIATTHQIWAQVDTTNYVYEIDEYNNISGPVDVSVTISEECYLDDDLEPSATPGWTATEDRDDDNDTAPFALVQDGSGYYGSSSHAWWVDNANNNLRTYLDSPSVTIPMTATYPSLRFWQRMRTENNYDGGWLRYRIGSGSWQDVTDDMIAQNGYTGNCGSSCPSGRHPAWEGTLSAHEVVVAVPDAAIGQSIQFRWQFECDDGTAAWNPNGWWIDDISLCVVTDPAAPVQPKPPGLEECARVVMNGNFDDPAGTDPWHYQSFDTIPVAGGHPIPSLRVMRLNAETLIEEFHPYLYQDLTMPEFITTTSSATLSLYKKVCEPENCSLNAGTTDPLYVVLVDPSTGVTLTQNIPVALGTDVQYYVTWSGDLFEPSMRLGGFDPYNYANRDLRLYFYAPNDGTADAWFFVDDVECEVCSAEPIPGTDPTKVTVGGLAQVLLGGVPRKMAGIDVYAYTADGELFSTYTIQDSTYHFYSVLPPGETIYIYAEIYVGGYRYWTQTTVPPQSGGDELHDVDLLLLPG